MRHRKTSNLKRMNPRQLATHVLGITSKQKGNAHSIDGLMERYDREAREALRADLTLP